LRTIDGAKSIWTLEFRKENTDLLTDADLFGPDKSIQTKPVCPSGGVCSLNAVGERPSCTISDHAID
jgi:hypothetical protein